MITTTKGEMEESLLENCDVKDATATETIEWVEYWLDGELVHRSVHVKLKHAAIADGGASSF